MNKKQIIIADDERALSTVCAMRCKQLGVSVQTASSGKRAYEMICENKPDLAILDIDMPEQDGLSVCEQIMRSDDPTIASIPVMIVSGRTDNWSIQRCDELGARYFHKAANVWENIKPIIVETLGVDKKSADVRQRKPMLSMLGKVLCIDDDPAITRAIQLRLRPYGIEVIRESNGYAGFDLAVKTRPNVIITDFSMPQGLGTYVLTRLRDCGLEIPVIILTGFSSYGEDGMQQSLIDMGASRVMTKPYKFDDLLSELRSLMTIPDQPVTA